MSGFAALLSGDGSTKSRLTVGKRNIAFEEALRKPAPAPSVNTFTVGGAPVWFRRGVWASIFLLGYTICNYETSGPGSMNCGYPRGAGGMIGDELVRPALAPKQMHPRDYVRQELSKTSE
eukprot:TRINITY_DN57747_c0_g1_i1.p1 TRINITY_DN57747_c0_g1~~TRINITY_DN57747_c0_g1_i1.p1  ORF type:complete len:120 (+),score=7.45 TRINITY_DN57747_c0_g1_i1:84-443(+)